MQVNFIANTIVISTSLFNLDDIRKFLLDKYPALCLNFKVGSHNTKIGRVFTYDWNGLFNETFGVKEFVSYENISKHGIEPIKHRADKAVNNMTLKQLEEITRPKLFMG